MGLVRLVGVGVGQSGMGQGRIGRNGVDQGRVGQDGQVERVGLVG